MARPFDTVAEQALQLSSEERVELAERLLSSVFSDEGLENEWSQEVESRIKAIENGRSQLIPAADAIARARAALQS